MKKITVLLILIIITINLYGCGKSIKINQSSNKVVPKTVPTELEEDNNDQYFGDYQMSEKGFSDKVKNNKIDKDYKTEWDKLNYSTEFSTQSCVELEAEYIKLWDVELNSIYKKLMSKLSEKNKNILRKAQQGWIQYNENDEYLVWENFIGGEENQLGSQGLYQVRLALKNRIRERTLKLMEYFYMMGNDIHFEYK